MWGDRFFPFRYFANRYFGTGQGSGATQLDGTLGSSGDLTKAVGKVLAGETSVAGSLGQHATKVLEGTVTPEGTLTGSLVPSVILIKPIGDARLHVLLHLHGGLTPNGSVETTGGTPVEPPVVVPAEGEGGGRWRPLDPYIRGPYDLRLDLEGELAPAGELIATVVRGQPRIVVLPDWTTPPDIPVELEPAAAAAAVPLPVIEALPRVNRRAERVRRGAAAGPRPVIAGPVPVIERLGVPAVTPTDTPEEPVPPLAPDVTPPDIILPTWPPLARPLVTAIAEAEAVEVEEAFVSTTRLPLYTREELMALGRRMRVGFRAPESDSLTPQPSPVSRASQSEGDTGGATAVRGRPATSRPRYGRGRPRTRD